MGLDSVDPDPLFLGKFSLICSMGTPLCFDLWCYSCSGSSPQPTLDGIGEVGNYWSTRTLFCSVPIDFRANGKKLLGPSAEVSSIPS